MIHAQLGKNLSHQLRTCGRRSGAACDHALQHSEPAPWRFEADGFELAGAEPPSALKGAHLGMHNMSVLLLLLHVHMQVAQSGDASAELDVQLQ